MHSIGLEDENTPLSASSPIATPLGNHLDRYHPLVHPPGQPDQFELDVRVPKQAMVANLRKHLNRPAPQQHDEDEDFVYKKPEDNDFLPPLDGKDQAEKYISYIPHSGFHNQRIALVNALLLAAQLNRTLLMPPVVFGDPIHWRKYDSLESFHRRMTKADKSRCRQYLPRRDVQVSPMDNGEEGEDAEPAIPADCQASFRYTSLRWDRLFNMTQIKQRVRVRYRDDYGRTYLQRTYALQPEDTYRIKDDLLYDYRVSDRSGEPLDKYQRELFLWDLRRQPERLLSFGSMFGSGRVMSSTAESEELRAFLNDQFVFDRGALPELFSEVDAILAKLGGARTYVAIHARVGDSLFERFSSQIMDHLWSKLQRYTGLVSPPASSDTLDQASCFAPPARQRAINWKKKEVIPGRPLVLFMATDATDPRHHPLFERIYTTFPCVITLADVYDHAQSSLANLTNPADGVPYGNYLIPFLDGLIASRAQEFTGSMWSTFSYYIRFLHRKALATN
ncbi:hypothetical protein DFQ28_009713 [Apophysomyces sp. BC1034]|nr:hypothetical protein DFQ30_011425 [Apophysomyces sp. BC1015]KAG0176933.1 hypothetical protein DFQ29_005448 [Apophysomyces sp. BC1021]KAG0185204.1 hypothetical protein DFQ28_009713 [Apophysomyces sp. BC1034]